MVQLFPPLRPKLSAALRDVTSKNERARAAAAEALGSAPEDRAEEARVALRPLLDDPMSSVRCAAIASLGQLKDAESVEVIIARFEDGDPTVRQVALIAAGEIGDERAIPALERGLRRPDAEVRFQAVASLALVQGEASIRRLTDLVDDEDHEVRAHLADALGSLETAAAIPPLRQLLADEDRRVREAASIALARCGDDSGADELVLLLTDRDRCFEAAWALGELKVEAAKDPLHRLATALLKPLTVKAAAAAALVRIGDPRGEPLLGSVLTALRSDARGYAAQLVGELGLISLAPEVAKLADRPRGADPMVVAEALAKLADRSEDARLALGRLAERTDAVGERAKALQKAASSEG
ncbi:MAG: HEAT repeat domain-containing protein [Sandaracinaceae bacterium]|nr:HEAT repeat domain-containing protein [Sandaracinaceae bacterium]